jgi:hypothetical protein
MELPKCQNDSNTKYQRAKSWQGQSNCNIALIHCWWSVQWCDDAKSMAVPYRVNHAFIVGPSNCTPKHFY